MAFSPNGPTAVRRSGATWPKQPSSAADIAGQRPHIGALAAFGLEHRMIRVGHVDELEPVDLDRARRKFDHLAVAGEIVGALAVDLDGGIARRHLLDRAGEARQQRRGSPRRSGGSSLVSTTRPSASSVSRSSPQRTVKR